jgi:hypothetical protein
LPNVIPEIDIWRVANMMLKRYGEEADIESAIRAEELAEKGDWTGEAIWRRIIDAIGQLENTTPSAHCADWDDDATLTILARGSASRIPGPMVLYRVVLIALERPLGEAQPY